MSVKLCLSILLASLTLLAAGLSYAGPSVLLINAVAGSPTTFNFGRVIGNVTVGAGGRINLGAAAIQALIERGDVIVLATAQRGGQNQTVQCDDKPIHFSQHPISITNRGNRCNSF